ncbi:MAG: flavin-containing monooxygenase [Acidimicrobiales bacterium]
MSTDVRVAVVGAGFSGIGQAAGLRRAGIDDFAVLEQAGQVGGTWRDNTYPGATCDVPSNLYSFSFAPNPHWSRSFSPQAEIRDYLTDCTRRFGIEPFIRFHHRVESARWDEAKDRWLLDTTAGPYTARFLVSARGPLSEPRLPAIDGIGDFEGTMFHSARWDHTHALDGERVAVIGTGASAIQFVPRIQPLAGSLSVFQRTAPWILPRRDRRLTPAEHRLFGALPTAQLAVRAAVYWGREAYSLGFVGAPARRRRVMAPAERMARRHLAAQVPDPDLRARLTPAYEMGCKRILLSNDYYPTLSRPNVDLVTDPIVGIDRRSVWTAGGIEHPVDTIILGTGFDVTGHSAAASTFGRGGVRLDHAWDSGMEAYRGTTVTGFPNLFFMVGPNSGLGHTSIVFIIESQISYVLDALSTMDRVGATSFDVRPDAQDRWNRGLAERSRHTVWTSGGCDSYYLDAAGRNVAVWPGSSWGYRRALRRFDPVAYRLTTCGAPRTCVGPASQPSDR